MTTQLDWGFIKDKSGYYWEAKEIGGELVGRASQYFKSRSGARYNAHLLGCDNEYSDAIQWQFLKNKQGKWEWVAHSTNNFEEIAAGHRTFSSETEAMNNARYFGYEYAQQSKELAPMSWGWLKWLVGGLALLGIVLGMPVINTWIQKAFSTPKTSLASKLKQGDTTRFYEFLNTAGLEDLLTTGDKKTVFAPINNAFAALPATEVALLGNGVNRDVLKDVVLSHIFTGDYSLSSLVDGMRLTALNGRVATVGRVGDAVTLDGVPLVNSGVNQLGGTIFTISNLLDVGNLTGRLVDTFASSVSSSSVSNDSSSTPSQHPTLFDRLRNDNRFSTLLTAVKAAGITDQLQGKNVTFFAPTNDAFSILPDGELERLLLPENKAELANLLRYHLMNQRVTANDLKQYSSISPVLGFPIYVTVDADQVHLVTNQVNHTRVIQSDIETSNGLIHVIDQILAPFQAK